MKTILNKMSRRERVLLLAGGAVLFLGVAVYPGVKSALAFREEKMTELNDELALMSDKYDLLNQAEVIREEHDTLQDALGDAKDLLFPPVENAILTQNQMIKMLTTMGPDLDLEVKAGRRSVGDANSQLSYTLKGEGRYPELLNFLQQLESHRPLILVDEITVKEKRVTRGRGRGPSTAAPKSGEPTLSLIMSLQMICQEGED